ncbi:hypothetical protein RYX36_027720 [Vicia faba]
MKNKEEALRLTCRRPVRRVFNSETENQMIKTIYQIQGPDLFLLESMLAHGSAPAFVIYLFIGLVLKQCRVALLGFESFSFLLRYQVQSLKIED